MNDSISSEMGIRVYGLLDGIDRTGVRSSYARKEEEKRYRVIAAPPFFRNFIKLLFAPLLFTSSTIRPITTSEERY